MPVGNLQREYQQPKLKHSTVTIWLEFGSASAQLSFASHYQTGESKTHRKVCVLSSERVGSLSVLPRVRNGLRKVHRVNSGISHRLLLEVAIMIIKAEKD